MYGGKVGGLAPCSARGSIITQLTLYNRSNHAKHEISLAASTITILVV